MTKVNRYGSWACVVGGAEGLGKAFAEKLANEGFNLIMVDVKKDLLENTSGQITEKYKVSCILIDQDLADERSVSVIFDTLKEKNCRFLVYNAAYGPVKHFLSNSEDELNLYLEVNIKSTVHLVYKMINLFRGQTHGILLLSSLAGFRGTQLVVPYAASKAYLWNLAEGLHYEYRDQGLDISVCCPGATDTPNYQSTGPLKIAGAVKPMSPEAVANEAIDKFGKRLFIVPGLFNKFIHFLFSRILPRRLASSIHNSSMKKLYEG